MPVSIHGAGILPTGPGALTVDSTRVRNMLAAGQRAGEAAVGAGRVVADPHVGRRPAALVVTCRAALQTTLVDVRTS